ncbi:MAG: Plug domain-containing protein, partial [Gemmatimonadota bacterium]|nr:Plug domain-containing protein [Gemmatimonadota bacterium]
MGSGDRTGAVTMRLTFAFVVLLAAPAAAQEPVRPDTVVRDTARLAPLTSEASRSPTAAARVPAAIATVSVPDALAGRPAIGLDEVLGGIPGVYVANRYNFALDQRLVIRGFGARAGFGIRGVKVLLDGVPQTLPDGQSQLTNLQPADLVSAEVLRGTASSRFGNASGGVVALRTA